MLILKIYKRSKGIAEAPREPSLPPPPAAVEKRKAARTDHIVKFKYKVLMPMEGEGFTQDISDRGIGLFLDNEVPPGAVMELRFQARPGDSRNVKPIAKIVWQKDYQAGVKVLGR